MTTEQAIKILERNRDANLKSQKFVAACNMAITAIKENKPLKNRCLALSGAAMCTFCRMKCPDLGDDKE